MTLMERMARIFANAPSQLVRFAMINGWPGFVVLEADGELQTTGLEIVDGKIAGVYVVRNPDKLGHLDGMALT